MTTRDEHWSAYYAADKDFRLLAGRDIDYILRDWPTGLEKTCLDIGCGSGQVTRELAHRGFRGRGIDTSTAGIELAQRRTVMNAFEYQVGDFATAYFAGQQFSLIVCKYVIAFMEDRDAFLQKVARLLAPGGRFVVITETYLDESDKTPIKVERTALIDDLGVYFSDVMATERGNATFVLCRAMR